MTARMARQYLTWRRWPRCWAVFSWRAISLRYEGDMVKRMQHIGTFLHNEMGISLRGISPMCGRSSIHLQKIFFLRSIAGHECLAYGTIASEVVTHRILLHRCCSLNMAYTLGQPLKRPLHNSLEKCTVVKPMIWKVVLLIMLAAGVLGGTVNVALRAEEPSWRTWVRS